MKIIAYYLPQFHETKENNEWWGEGFTEWTNMKKAKPLFKSHNQPREPLEGYYDLMNKSTMTHQAELMNKYGVDAMAFYHYWLDDNKMLLNKPAENLLEWKNINMNFMFFWANHDWIRSWNGTQELLMKQKYGNKEEWESHFKYMLPFFKDKRYLKKDNKPMFGIYFTDKFPNLDEMLLYWNSRAIEEGFNGIYVIDNVFKASYQSPYKYVNAVVLRQPNMAQLKYSRIYNISKRFPKLQPYIYNCYPLKLDYEKVKKNLIKITKQYVTNKDLIYGDFTGWDNTPRHGKRGYVFTNQSIEVFEKYFKKLYDLANKNNVDYIFINAWNEWCEGMYLEPDTTNGYKFLEVIRKVKGSN